MDSSGFPPHGMGGPNQAMQLQQAQLQQQQRQQQQQQQPGMGAQSQIQYMIQQALQNTSGPLSGWQSQFSMNERIGLIFSMYAISSALKINH
jgi:hypothetical protein